jgi:S1-C subfamily serine protease
MSGMDASVNEFLSHTSELKGLITSRTDGIASMVMQELADRDDTGAEALRRASSNTEDITAVKRHLLKNCRSLKESMVYPTVQLRGNGTVGSGVVIFSRPRERNAKSDAAKQPCLTFILTAYHVVLEVTTEECRHRLQDVRIMGTGDRLQRKKYEAQVITFDRARDIALLQLVCDEPMRHVAAFAAPQEIAAIEVFEPAYAVGCPLGNMPLPSAGEITTKQKRVGDQVFWMLNAPTYFGNSGGGVFRARDGKLIGVSSMIYTYGRKHPVVVPHLGLFVPAEVIFTWLDKEGFGFLYDPAREIPKTLASIRPEAADRAGRGSGETTLERVGYRSSKGSL